MQLGHREMTISEYLNRLRCGNVGKVEWLTSRIAELIDLGRSDEIVDIIGKDCSLEFGEGSPSPGIMSGFEAVSKFFIDRANNSQLKTRHIVTNLNISELDDNRIKSKYIYSVYRGEAGCNSPESLVVADVIDLYLIEEGSLKLSQRKVTPSFQISLKS